MAFGNILHKTTNRFLDELVKNGKLSSDLPKAIKARFQTPAQIAEFLFKNVKISEEDITKASAASMGLGFVHLQGKSIPREVLTTIPEEIARKFSVIAFEKQENILKVAVGRPYNLNPSNTGTSDGILGEIEKKHSIKIELYATTMVDVSWALGGYSTKPEIKSPQVPTSPPLQETDLLKAIDLTKIIIPKNILQKFPKEIAQKYSMIVFDMPSENKIKVAVVNPLNPRVKDILEFIEKKNDISIDLYQTDISGINYALQGYLVAKTPVTENIAPATSSVEHPTPESQPPTTATVSVPNGAQKINVDELGKDLPSGKSPDVGGVLESGIIAIGVKDIQPMQASNMQVGLNNPAGSEGVDNLEERNLDTFLGKEITNTNELIEIVKSGFVPKMVGAILSYGIYLRASDIHLEPLKHFYRLRYRVDGELEEYAYIPLTLHPPITSRIKIFSNLKIDEQRVPQDGRYDAIAGKHEFDVRVSSLPTVFGEKIVMRLLDKSSGAYTLEQLGFLEKPLEKLVKELAKPWGIILATGPTGSGKSTTLYAVLNRIANPKVNVITLEDPVEYEMKGVNQVQVKPKIGFSFAEGLRSVLRQDPNIIMVGEIRDGETAGLATHAALTGHLVLSTLHTNNAAGAVPRLINMGVEPYLITSAMNAVIAQRLVRKLCQECKEPSTIPEKIKQDVNNILSKLPEGSAYTDTSSLSFYKPKGCSKCKNGFSGRIGIYEILIMSDKLEEAAIDKKPATEIEDIAIAEGMVTLQQDGIIKATKGLTTLDEVFKVTSSE